MSLKSKWYEFHAKQNKVDFLSTDDYIVTKAVHSMLQETIIATSFKYSEPKLPDSRLDEYLEYAENHLDGVKTYFERGNPQTKMNQDILSDMLDNQFSYGFEVSSVLTTNKDLQKKLKADILNF